METDRLKITPLSNSLAAEARLGEAAAWMGETSAEGHSPIPPAKKDDSEDVAWALSTAEAMYARGDRSDALKWLRRAAESASEAEADDRALELAKAAADLATVVGPSAPPPPVTASSPPPPATPAVVAQAPAPQAPAPVVAPVATFTTGPAASSPPVPAVPAPAPSNASAASTVSAPAVIAALAAEESTPLASGTEPSVPTQRTPQTTRVNSQPTPLDGRALLPPIGAEFGGAIQSNGRDEMHDDAPEDKTGTGVPAYEARAKMASEAPSKPALEDAPAQVAQAIRVVVWRTAGGVHVAPHGTQVAAITVDAMLVALDPSADLARWLSAK